jgi:hypothetical protein
LIGINYVGHSVGELSGCVGDVIRMYSLLKSQGFPVHDPNFCKVIVDEKQQFILAHPEYPQQAIGFPNKNEIINSWNWLVTGAQPGDSLFMHYSGHGGQVADQSGDEEDGFDETVIPHDYKSTGQIVDDDIFDLLPARVPPGAHLAVVMDCCHSGTILDLPFTFVADDATMQQIHGGKPPAMSANGAFKNSKYGKFFGLAGDFLNKHTVVLRKAGVSAKRAAANGLGSLAGVFGFGSKKDNSHQSGYHSQNYGHQQSNQGYGHQQGHAYGHGHSNSHNNGHHGQGTRDLSFGNSQSTYGVTQPTYGASQPNYGSQPYGASQPTYGTSMGGYYQPSPTKTMYPFPDLPNGWQVGGYDQNYDQYYFLGPDGQSYWEHPMTQQWYDLHRIKH